MITNRIASEYREFPDEVFCEGPLGAPRWNRTASSRDFAAFPKRPLTGRIASASAPSLSLARPTSRGLLRAQISECILFQPV